MVNKKSMAEPLGAFFGLHQSDTLFCLIVYAAVLSTLGPHFMFRASTEEMRIYFLSPSNVGKAKRAAWIRLVKWVFRIVGDCTATPWLVSLFGCNDLRRAPSEKSTSHEDVQLAQSCFRRPKAPQ